ncbi:hypothetical protein FOA43_004575 [Brettanomyces nanus]|uniref:DUF202 domain-containing protein n=1 Tax=Eeniella nana TaxID=13502 RepID=A0A875SCI1_EENNA|nr:uncharacterized protein FOA43_004575 [Brettanomyces nanus]QPG77169.1 hypothetical protein FOA43_004575 [Brettanomyces nanus]
MAMSTIISPRRPDLKKPKTLFNFGSLLLENKNTVARDHLASERTFLAWLRTSISLSSIGIGLTQLLKIGEKDSNGDQLVKVGKIMGMCFIAVSTLTLCIGGFRYFAVQELLLEKKFPASVTGIVTVVVFAMILSISTFIIVMKM